jgi:hypothetical protein
LTSNFDIGSLKWFQDELRELQDSQFVNMFIHVSQDDTTDDSSSGGTITVGDIKNRKKETMGSFEYMSLIRRGRPNIADLVANRISRCPPQYQVRVGTCGPMKLLEETREASFQEVLDNGPSITLHTEVSFATVLFV